MSAILYAVFVVFGAAVSMQFSVELWKRSEKRLSESMSEFAERANGVMTENQKKVNDFILSKEQMVRELARNQSNLMKEMDEVKSRINEAEDEARAEMGELRRRIEALEQIGEQAAGINNQLQMMMDYNPQKEIGVVR